jgi:hypothetical protein
LTGRRRNQMTDIWSKIDIGDENQCWNWLRGTRNGYGHFCSNYQGFYAHRVVWELFNNKEAPKGKQFHVMHSCNNKLCCNPKHLSIGTASKNTKDAVDDGLSYGNTRYSDEIIRKIRNDNRSQLKIAADYGISQSHISRIKRKQSRNQERSING